MVTIVKAAQHLIIFIPHWYEEGFWKQFQITHLIWSISSCPEYYLNISAINST